MSEGMTFEARMAKASLGYLYCLFSELFICLDVVVRTKRALLEGVLPSVIGTKAHTKGPMHMLGARHFRT